MPVLEELSCAGCGAPVENIAAGAKTVECVYCGRTLRLAGDHTEDTQQFAVARVTDQLLRGYAGPPFGQARRADDNLAARQDWANPAHAVWPVRAHASSQYNSGAYSAKATVGPPKVFPRVGDIAGSWAPGSRRSQVEWIELEFPDVGPVTTIRVFETCMPGSTFAVTERAPGGGETLIYQGPPTLLKAAQILEIQLPSPKPIRALRVYITNDLGSGWAEIDTVAVYAQNPIPIASQVQVPVNRGGSSCVIAGAVLLALMIAIGGFITMMAASGDPSPPSPMPLAPTQTIAGSLQRWTIDTAGMAREGVVWANTVLGRSSEYNNPASAATQALGAPDVFPTYGDEPNAWAPRGQNGGDEYIEVAFAAPVNASAVVIVETYGAGAVARVDDITPGAIATTLWAGRARAPDGQAHVITVELSQPRMISAVRVVLDTTRVDGWNELDAIGLYPAR